LNRKERRRLQKLARGGAASSALFTEAVKDMEEGRAERAERLFLRVIEATPEHADAHHLLGLIAYGAGRIEEAADHIIRAIQIDETNPAYHANYGAVANLRGMPQEAEASSRYAIGLNPDYGEAYNNLAVSLEVQGRLDEAARACRDAIRLTPGNADARVNMGNLLMRQGEPGAAVESYRFAIELAPAHAMAHANLGSALHRQGKLKEAEAACRRAIDINPASAEAHNNLGTILMAAADRSAAVLAFRQAITFKPEYPEAHLNLGSALYVLDRFADSEAAYRDLLEMIPDWPEALNGLGVVLLAGSRLEEAEECFRRAAEAKPEFSQAVYNLASSGAQMDDKLISAMEDRAADEGLAGNERIDFHFALGQIYDAKGEADAAFAHFRSGNGLRRAALAAEGHGFDADDHDRLVGRICGAFPPGSFEGGKGIEDERPVFIVGMPRSGTTLVEQIAASHASVFGAGEGGGIADMVSRLPGDFPENMEALEDPEALARAYMERLGTLAPESLRIIDKTPFNFLYLGLIARLFPQARIVHCRRDAMDTGLSCYFQNFAAPHPWSTELGDLGRYMEAEARLMKHWHEVLPMPVFEIRYEDLVADQEGQSRRLIDALGLPWDAACLAFHENKRWVRSASNWQVRRPLHGASVGRWKAYKEHLGPLERTLHG
jgi:tetratricopeptide (TPR) repeat protein